MKSIQGEKRGVVSYKLYKVNNITTSIYVNLCGPIENHPTSSVLMVGRKEIELNDLFSEVISYNNTQIMLSYTLKDSIPDCETYHLQVNYQCNNTLTGPVIANVDYDINDPFFCSNIMFVY
ncbi:hypothetical protein ENU1_024660 [Entamoeba nuttalli P19]|uniref:Uncharacterized protein n=1 Tax=Entamoeba nuttalli (strain P19) TaxID=1076696 RepID=K2H6Z5_ENTNP|nr:hypothetical protein ENU1_024660 [Entamoeba nuttalli P19]EKE42327.1 hypothetical protein ENU1_024660 [Entamoeba nuttalli P19]|eukprot:XP_008855334.1 hypothetical protein ENU1_024660 [Entamoeba nuttalli P19]